MFTKSRDIAVPIRDAWKTLANLGDIYRFHPGVSKSYYTSGKKQGVGAARICELQPAGKIKETATSWEEGRGFTLQIDPIEKAPPVKNFTGQFRLSPLDAGRTRIDLVIRYDMKLGLVGNLLNALVIRSKMEEGIEVLLDGMKVHLEQGVDVPNVKSLKKLIAA